MFEFLRNKVPPRKPTEAVASSADVNDIEIETEESDSVKHTTYTFPPGTLRVWVVGESVKTVDILDVTNVGIDVKGGLVVQSQFEGKIHTVGYFVKDAWCRYFFSPPEPEEKQ
jgi:hypothetical protein